MALVMIARWTMRRVYCCISESREYRMEDIHLPRAGRFSPQADMGEMAWSDALPAVRVLLMLVYLWEIRLIYLTGLLQAGVPDSA